MERLALASAVLLAISRLAYASGPRVDTSCRPT